VFPAAARLLRIHRVPQAQARRAGLRRDAGVLREAQLAGGLAGDGDRAAAPDLRAGGRLRHAATVLLRLCGRGEGLAPPDGRAGARGDAEVQAAGAEKLAPREGSVGPWWLLGGAELDRGVRVEGPVVARQLLADRDVAGGDRRATGVRQIDRVGRVRVVEEPR